MEGGDPTASFMVVHSRLDAISRSPIQNPSSPYIRAAMKVYEVFTVPREGLYQSLLLVGSAYQCFHNQQQFLLALSVDHSILMKIHHIFMKITSSINSGGDIHVYRQCIMDVLPICALFFDRQKLSLKNTAFLPSLRSITG